MTDGSEQAHAALVRLVRDEGRRVLATLVRPVSDLIHKPLEFLKIGHWCLFFLVAIRRNAQCLVLTSAQLNSIPQTL